jgi:hypothetical protein
MANRNLSSQQITANNLQNAKFFELLYLRVRDTGTSTLEHTYISNAPYDITVDTDISSMGIGQGTQTFTALGPFLQFGNVDESADFQINSVTITLGGVRDADLELFLGNQYLDQPMKIFRVWYDDAGTRIGDPVMIFDGRIDKPVISDDPENGITIGCAASSQWVDYERRAGRHTNPSEQKFFFANDTGFKFANIAIKDLKWGGS